MSWQDRENHGQSISQSSCFPRDTHNSSETRENLCQVKRLGHLKKVQTLHTTAMALEKLEKVPFKFFSYSKSQLTFIPARANKEHQHFVSNKII